MVLVGEHTTVERFAIELKVGACWSRKYGPTTNEMVQINTEGVRLEAGESIVVEVEEALAIPYNMYGLVIPTGSLFLDSGIIIAAAKIEPSFTGKLKLRLVNISGDRRTLKRHQKIASAIFFSTELTEFHPEVGKAVVAVEHLPPRLHRIGSWISANRVIVIGWLLSLLSSSVTGALLVYFVLPPRYSTPPPATPSSANAPAAPDSVSNTIGTKP